MTEPTRDAMPADRWDTTGATAALVTGGAVRIGQCLVETLAERGCDVAIHYRGSSDAAEAAAARAAALGVKAVTVQADLADMTATAGLVARASAALDRPLDLLVNNASLFENDRIDTLTPESLEAHLAVNTKAPLLLAQAFARDLPDDRGGNIVNVIDERVLNPTPWFLSYTLSKAGLLTLTRTLAMALAPRIRVNGIGPGPVLRNVRQTEEQFARQWRSTLLGRGAPPAEIAAALTYILSAPALTGQMLAIDGGQHLPWPPLTEDLASLDG